jgi:hypothetical protein
MPAMRAWKTCQHPGCPALIRAGTRCPKHAEQYKSRQQQERNNDATMKLYRTQRWERMKDYMRSRNPLCQRILDDGSQCEQPSSILHHIVSPRENPALMFSAENLLCVCDSHHPSTAGETDPSRYVPTVTD